jgi:hypothetical protein
LFRDHRHNNLDKQSLGVSIPVTGEHSRGDKEEKQYEEQRHNIEGCCEEEHERVDSSEEESAKPDLTLEMFKPSILIQWFVAALVTKAWETMGLVADPLSGKVEKDLSEARLAIDAIGALYPVMKEGMSPEEKKKFEALLSDMRINFVNQSQRE